MTTPALRRLRHVDVDPAAPLASWPFEALVAVLDTVEGISDESAAADYPGVMRANLATLRLGQDCP